MKIIDYKNIDKIEIYIKKDIITLTRQELIELKATIDCHLNNTTHIPPKEETNEQPN